jgi:D-arginine dehydrogenase
MSGPDIVIVGGGIAGLSAGWALSEEASVVVLEREDQLASHATGRSAAVISETYGPRALCALAAASRAFLESPPDEFAPVPLARPRGLLWITRGASLVEVSDTAARLGVRCVSLTPDEVVERVPVIRGEWPTESLLEPDAMSIDVAALVDGHRRGIRERGGRIATTSEALRLERTSSRWEVRTGKEVLRCDIVVDAGGAWADEVARRAGVEPVGIQPYRRTAFVFPVADPDPTGWPLVVDAGGRFYFEPEGDGLLASPADETPTDPHDARADPMAMAMATDALAEATTLVVKGVRRQWAGLRTFAPDRRPVIGFEPGVAGFFWLAGQGSGGIKTSPAMAAAARNLIFDTSTPELERVGLDIESLGPGRFRS